MKEMGFVMTFDDEGIFVLGVVEKVMDNGRCTIKDMFGGIYDKKLIRNYKEITRDDLDLAFVLREGKSPRC